MDAISLISKFLIGYKIKRKLVKGIPMEYRYSGKPVFFDPISMIQEASFKIDSTDLILNENSESFQRDGQFNHGELEPSVSVSWKQNDKNMKAYRFVKADSQKASSLYEFYSGDILFATFLRIYDFGKDFEMLKDSFKIQIGDKVDAMKGLKIQGSKDSILYAENFGHSQFWKLFSYSEIKGFD
ncbi:hypothetical protein [Algoriphagus zhangzhouensis]|uniref:Uncharacterized protein n=1 Tax=Algoriphagus zhangzhouensis TaxID=1073327 RepID=A0A1M7Z3M9_9BACT|nr:hypothetical protein [Algoriphagus zhangzhouensis]TDY48353.1 hypothetical protein A8938_0036 [Algoriphagus zhangzhouensis]SHO59400.1 hypothetical protein SAMN04488108_0036 [Algoriphagus zhangzhouensis]